MVISSRKLVYLQKREIQGSNFEQKGGMSTKKKWLQNASMVNGIVISLIIDAKVYLYSSLLEGNRVLTSAIGMTTLKTVMKCDVVKWRVL